MKNDFSTFCPLVKVDYNKRLIYGRMTQEIPDGAKEIMDYATSKPNFMAWSESAKARTALLPEEDQSLGNLRLMHQPISVGKVIEIDYKDAEKAIDIGTFVADDTAWDGVLKGQYTGFSIGGSYDVKWVDPTNPSLTRYTARPVEVSLVDSPAVPTATFTMIKADGTEELHKLGEPLDVSPLPAEHAVDTPTNPPPTPPAVPIADAPDAMQEALPGVTVTDKLETWTPQVVVTPADDPKPVPVIADHFVVPDVITDDSKPADGPETSPPGVDAAPDETLGVLKAFTTAVNKLVALHKATDDAKDEAEAKLKALGSRVGIARREGEPLTQPKDYPADADDYGDPANWSWPCDSTARCQSAMAYFNGGKGRDKYADREWHVLGRRIAQRTSAQLGTRYQYSPETKQISQEEGKKMLDKQALESALKKGDVNGLMNQINAALTVAADEIGKNPANAKELLMQVLGNLQAADNAAPANTTETSPTAPMNGGGQGDGVGKADGASTQPPMTAAAEATETSTPTPTETPDANKALVDRIDALTASVAKLVEQQEKALSAAKAEAVIVEKNAPAGDLAAILNSLNKQADADPVMSALTSGDKDALKKAVAAAAGGNGQPDPAAVVRKAQQAAVESLTPAFTQMMLAQGLQNVPTFQQQSQ